MQRWSLSVVVLGYTLVGAALVAAQQPLPIPGATVSAGQQYFVRYCSACHGVAGHGDGPSAPALRMPPQRQTTARAIIHGPPSKRLLFVSLHFVLGTSPWDTSPRFLAPILR